MRINIFAKVVYGFFCFVASGLFYTQVIKYAEFKELSETNRVKVVPLVAPRGTIFDRNGKVVVKDKLCFNASIVYSDLKNKGAAAEKISRLLGVPRADIDENIKKARLQPFSAVCVVYDIGMKGAIQIEEMSSEYPGLLLEVSSKRDYVNTTSGAALIGYLGLINASEYQRLKCYGYRVNDLIGRSGVERYYENYLRGTSGGKQIEVDHLRREISVLGYETPVRGKDLCLTIDLELQKLCDELMRSRKGAIVVMRTDGQILALSSFPGFDPAIFIDKGRSKQVKAVLNDAGYPLMNRAIAGQYPPGSIFKLVVSAAGLDSGKINESTSAECSGKYKLGGIVFGCTSAHGHVELIAAIAHSCNVFFYTIGGRIGVVDISRYARSFGLGEKTGVDLLEERPGFVPTQEWKRKKINEKWQKGDTLNLSIGQGYLLVTPLQIARIVAAFANGGYLVRPHLADKIGGIDTNNFESVEIGLSKSSIRSVKKGMRECVASGTGKRANVAGFTVSGKTGTAQTSKGVNHGWFAGFAPFDDPKIVVVVFDEFGGQHGGELPAEVAGEIFHKAAELKLL